MWRSCLSGYNGVENLASFEDRLTQPAAPIPADAAAGSWVNRAPAFARPYLRLSRYDRPIGFWLLILPCLIGLANARLDTHFEGEDLYLALLFSAGGFAMRGAGCTWNDLLDRDIDARVARTALRPLPAGEVAPKQALAWLVLQCLVGLAVLAALPPVARWVALASIPFVALYPLMKRITWWPQVWLGLTFNWGVLVSAASIRGEIVPADVVLYAALTLWTLGYDTIYAIQDREDDAMVGVRSTARRFGGHVRPAVAVIYAACAALVAVAGGVTAGWAGAGATVLFAAHLAQQAVRLKPDDGGRALALFRANRDAGLLLFAGWAFLAGFNSPMLAD